MIIALPTLVFIQDAIFSAIGRLVRPYYKSFSLTFKSQNEGDEDDDQVFAEYDEEKGVVFFPPMYAQRYAAFSDCLMDERWAGQLEKIVDFGYNDMSFIRYIKEMPGVKKIVGVDLDSIPLRCSSDLLGVSEYGPKRETPVQVMLFQGNAADPDYRLIGTDAVVAIELIEHMLPHDLDRFVHTIFGFIKPRIAVISTPNGDFNVLFKSLESNGFRRLDHFFEWSREQFHDWCSNIVERYPGYTVTCQGIGPGPDGTAHLGCCSQMALFVAKSYRKQMELTVNSLALVAQTEQNYYYVNSESGDTDISSQPHSTEMQILNYGTDILQRQTLTIYMSGPVFGSYDDSLENCDKTSQCNLDSELGKNYLMDGEEVASSETSVIVPRRRDRYNVYEIGDIACRLNCTTLQARKFSKTTQNLMSKNGIKSLIHTKEVVDEIKSLAKMLNFDRTSLAKKHSNIWNNINWGDNAPYWNEYYKLVKEFSYPFEVISEESRILDVITDEINRLIDEQFDEDYAGFTNNYHSKLEIPVEYLVRKVRHITSDVAKVREVLEWNGYEIVDDVVIYTRTISEETSLEDVSYEKESQLNDNRDEDLLLENSGVDTRIRRAIDKKIQKLRSTLTADEDISFEIDRVVCQLVRLALRTNRHRDTLIPTRWLLLKLYDLLTLNIKAIEKKKVHFSCHYEGSLAITDDIDDNKSDVTHTIDKSYVIETEDTNSYITQIVENLANNVQPCDNSEEQSEESISITDIQLLDNIPEETSESQNIEDDQDAMPTLRKPSPDYVQESPKQLEINQIDLNELNQCQTDTELLEYSAEFINQRYDMLRNEVHNGLIEDLAKMTLNDLDLDQVQVLNKLMEYSYKQYTQDIVHVKHSDIQMLDQPGSDPYFSYQSLRLNESELNTPADEPYRIELSKLDLKQLDQYELELYRLEQSFNSNKLYMPLLNEIEDITYNPEIQINNQISNVGNTHIYDNVNDFLCHSNFFETLKKYQEDNTALEIMKKYKDILNSEAETEDECDKDTKESGVFDGDNFSYLSSNVFSNGNYIVKHPESGGLNLSGETESYLNQCDDSGNENFSRINKSLSSSSTETLDANSQCESVSSEHTSKNDAFECECDSWIEQNIDNSGSTFCRSTGINSIATVDIPRNVTKNKDKKIKKKSKSNLFSKSGKKTDISNWKKSQNKIANSSKFVANGANIITENIESNQVPLDVKVKKDDNTARHLQSKVTKPIPGEITTYCQSNTETVQKIIEVSEIFSKDKCSNVQANTNVADTEESMLVEIITDAVCETISLRRTIGTSFDDIDNISEQEVIHDEVLLDSNLSTACLHSAENFQTQTIAYDLDQPSTSKCFRLVTNEVQCGPDIAKSYSYNPSKKDTETSTHNYDFCSFSPPSKRDNTPSTCQVGIKIKDSNDSLQDQPRKSRETNVNVETEPQLDVTREKTTKTYLSKPTIERKNEPSSLTKPFSDQLIDLKAPECENLKIDDLGNDLNCSLESLPIKLPESLNKSTNLVSNLDTDMMSNNETQLKLQRGSVCIHSYKDKKVLEDVVFQGEWQRYRTSSLSPERPSSNISSKYLSETSMKKLRSSSTPIYLRNKCKSERSQPKKVFSTIKPLKLQLIKSISKDKLMKLPSDVITKLNRLSGETRYLSDTTMKRANDFQLKERNKTHSIKIEFDATRQTRRLVSFSRKPLATTKTLNDKNNLEPVKKKCTSTLPVKKYEVQRQCNTNEKFKSKLKLENSTKKTVASRTTKRKSTTKLSFVTSKASKDRVLKKANSKTCAAAQKNCNHQKNKHPVPCLKNQTEETRPKADSYSIFTNMLFPTANDSDYNNINPLQKLFEHNLNYLLYRTELNITNSTEKSPSPTSLRRPSNSYAYRSPSPTLIRPAPKKSSSLVSFIQNIEKNDDDTLGSPDCSSVNSVCTVKELSPRYSKSPDRITTLPERKFDESPRANSKISKIPRLTKPMHRKVVDPHAKANTGNSSSPRLTEESPVGKKLGIPRLTKHSMKTSTPFSTQAKNIIIAQVVTTDTSNTGFTFHSKAAVEIDRDNVDSKLKIEPNFSKKVSSEAASSSTPKANAIADNTQTDDTISSGNNITSEILEIKADAELSNNINDTNSMDHKMNLNNQIEDAIHDYNAIDLSSILNSESIKIANEECVSKVTVQEIFTPYTAGIAGTESIADTMVTVTDTDMMSFRSISSDNEFTEAYESVENSAEIKDIFDRRKRTNIQSPPQTGTWAAQVFSGYSVDGPNVGDCHDPVNVVDSETGSVADGTALMVTSEEVFVSGRSSESYQLSQDVVVPDWLFNLIDLQNRASGGEHQMEDDEVPLLLPTPPNLTNNVVAMDLNGNVVVEGLVGAAAGAGDGRGIFSRDSSGRGSSLSSSDEDTSRFNSEAASDQSTYQSTSADIPGTSSESTLHLGTSNISSSLADDQQLQTESNSAFNQSLPYSSSGCDADVSSNDTDVQN